LTIAAVVILALAAAANAELINVNVDTTARTESTLDGPVGSDVGTTWNQILHESGWFDGLSETDLLDSTGAATTVDFTTDSGCMWPWGNPDLVILTSAVFAWNWDTVQTLTISGLNGSEKYDLYLASFHPNEGGSRALFSTDNTTTTASPQTVDNGGSGGNNDTWVEGENFALFEDVEPDGSNKIIVTFVSDSGTSAKRAYLSGFQLVTAGTEPHPPGPATNPSPANGALGILVNVDLSWTAGIASDSSDVYFGTDPTPDSGEFQGNQPGTTFYPGTMAEDTYYWRIDAVNNEGTTTGPVWSFTVGPPGKAVGPSPYDSSTGIPVNADLSWTAGEAADSSDVYFGTDPTPDSGEFQGNRVGTTFHPGTMAEGTTYYWRIDSVNTLGTTTGEVWSFTTITAPIQGRNTFLVPIPVPGASWEELAYLAAVPASAAANAGGPSVIALDEFSTIPDAVSDYLTLYNPANTYTIDTTGSLDEVACYLAQTFWKTTTSVVLCDDSDYPGALAASALAGRMEVPLIFFDGSTGLSSAALGVINNDLQCATALTVNGNSTVTSQLSGISVSQTSLADDKAIITWMGNNGYPVEYLAVCNANDRGMSDYAPKGSLAAALLAAERNGAVAALTYDTGFNIPFFHSSETTQKPAGLPSNADPPRKYHDPEDLNYHLGSFTLNGETHDFVIVRIDDSDKLDAVFIDFNDDGDYGDAGEYCPRTSEVTINGKRYTVGVNSTQGSTYFYGELRFSYPCDDELKEDLQEYHDQIGHHPKCMAIVGVLQVLPCAHALSYDRGWCDYVMNDNYFADVDDDPLYEIAIGRIVGEDVTYVTLNATRCLTYNDLLSLPSADRMAHMCPEEFAISLYDAPHQFENCGFTVDNWYTIPTQDRSIYGVFIQDEHGWPFGIAPPTRGPIAPSLVEAGGCNIASLDKYSTTHDWYDYNAVVLARRGAICLNAWVRGTGASKDWARDNFYKAILYDGATLGEAHLHALNTMAAEDENWDHQYDLTGNMFYGDPAVTLYTPPAGPTYAAAHVTANGNTLTVHAPETYWVDYVEPRGVYAYTAPGLAGSVYEPAWTLSATYTTDLQITNMTQESGVPNPLGWMEMREGQDYVIDEHWDNTRTIHWRIRLDEFNKNTGNFEQTIDEIDYTIVGYLPGDFDLDGSVDYRDMVVFTEKWLYEAVLLAEDLNRDGFVNFTDFATFAKNWLEYNRLPSQASNPHPADGATGVSTTADLSWTGAFSESHDVYFGTTNPPPFIGNQTAKTFDPGTMAPSTTYYWRIDEVNPLGTTTGTVWSFTTGSGPPPY